MPVKQKHTSESIPIEFLSSQSAIASFITALEKQTEKEFKDIYTKDQTKVTFQYNGQTYTESFYNITQRISCNKKTFPEISTKSEAKTYLAKTAGLETKSPEELLQEKAFVSSFITALEKQTGKEFKDISIADQTKVTFQYNGQTYMESLKNITERISKNEKTFPEINTKSEAKTYLAKTIKHFVEKHEQTAEKTHGRIRYH